MLGDDASYIAQVLIGIALRPTFFPQHSLSKSRTLAYLIPRYDIPYVRT